MGLLIIDSVDENTEIFGLLREIRSDRVVVMGANASVRGSLLESAADEGGGPFESLDAV